MPDPDPKEAAPAPEAQPEATPTPEAPAKEPAKGDPPEPKEARADGVREAIAAAKERVAKGEPLVPEEEEGAEEEPAAPKAEKGEAEAAAEAPEGKPEDEPGDPPESEEAPPEGAEGDDDPDEGEGDDPEAGDDKLVQFALPPRNEGGPDVLVEISEELKEDFARLVNGYRRGEAVRAERAALDKVKSDVLADREELDFIKREAAEDPVGFLMEYVPASTRRDVLMHLLADDELWGDEELQENLRKWDRSPEDRETFRIRQERDRLAGERKRREEHETTRAAKAGAKKTAERVLELVPEGMEGERRERFYRLAMNRLGELAATKGRTDFERAEVVAYLEREGILDGFGIDPASVRDNGDGDRPKDEGRSGGGAGKSRPSARARRVTVEEAEKTGEKLKARSDRRRAAAAYAPSGAGAPAAAVELPRGQSVKERIAHVRKTGVASVLNS